MPQPNERNLVQDTQNVVTAAATAIRAASASHWLLWRRPTTLGTRTVGWPALLGASLYMPTIAFLSGGESAHTDPGAWGWFWAYYFLLLMPAWWLQFCVSKAKFRGIHPYEIGETWLCRPGTPLKVQRRAEAAVAVLLSVCCLSFSPPLALAVFGAWLCDVFHVGMIRAKYERQVVDAYASRVEWEVFRENFQQWRE